MVLEAFCQLSNVHVLTGFEHIHRYKHAQPSSARPLLPHNNNSYKMHSASAYIYNHRSLWPSTAINKWISIKPPFFQLPAHNSRQIQLAFRSAFTLLPVRPIFALFSCHFHSLFGLVWFVSAYIYGNGEIAKMQ